MDFINDIIGYITDIFDGLLSAAEALFEFENKLVEFDNYILSMVEAARGGTVNGLPINQAIGTFRYLVGDLAFSMFYFLILFGCMFTIWHLCMLIWNSVSDLKNQAAGGGTSLAGFAGMLGKLFR